MDMFEDRWAREGDERGTEVESRRFARCFEREGER